MRDIDLDDIDLDDEDDYAYRENGVLSPEGMQICEHQCSTCIFRPGNKMNLSPGRFADMVQSVKDDDGFVVCHKTLDWDTGAICHGSFDRIKTTPIQLAERLGYIRWVDPDDDHEYSGPTTEPDRT